MTCADFQRKLSAYTDGELSRWTRWKVQHHLEQCPDCAGLLREFEEIDSALLGSVQAEPAPAYLTDSVMRRLPAMPPPWRRPATVVRWATAGALAGVQIMAVYGAYWWGFARGSVRPEHGGVRGGLSAPLGGASLRTTPMEPRLTGRSTERSARPSRPVSVWGRRDLEFPSALPESVSSPAPQPHPWPSSPLVPVLNPGGAH